MGVFDIFGGDDEKKKRRREEEARRQREEEQRQREEAAEEREAAIEEREKERQAQEEERQAQAEAERAARQKALEQMASETESFAQEFAQSSKPQSQKPQGPDAGGPDAGPVQPIVAEANRQVDRGLGRMGSTAAHVGSQAQGQLGGRSLNLPQSPAIQGQASQVIGDASRPQGPQRTPGQFTPSQLGQGRPPAGSPQSLQTAAQAPQQNQGGQGAGQSSTSPGQPSGGTGGAPQTPMAPPVQAQPTEDLVQIQRRINQGRQGQGQAGRDAAVRDRVLGQTDRALEGLRPEGLRNVQAQYNQNAMMAEEEPSTAPSTPSVSRPVPINEDTPERQLQRTEQMGLLDPWSSDMGSETVQSPEEAALAQLAGEGAEGSVPGISINVDEIQTSPRRAQDRTQLPDNVEADLGRATEALREGVEQPVAYDAEGNPLPPTPGERSRRTPSPRVQQAVAEGRVDPTVAPELESIDNSLRQQVQRDLENGDITEEEAAAINAAIDQNISGQAQEVTVSEENNAIPPSAQQPTTEQPTTEQPTAEEPTAEGATEGSDEAQSEDERVENEDGLTQEEVQEILNDPEPPNEEVMETLRTFSENDQELRDMQAGLAAVRQINSRLAEAIENQLQDNTPTTFEEEIDRAREQRSKARRLAVIGKVLAFVGLFLGHASGSEDMMGLGVLIGKLLGGISKTNEEAATADLEALEQQRQNVEGGQMAELQRYQALAQARMAEVEQLNRMRGQRQADERLRLQDERNQQRYELDQRRLEEDRALDDPESELSEIERRNLSVINGTLVQRGFRGLSPEEIEMMSGRAARSTRVQLERVLGNRNVRGGGLGTGGGPTGSTAITREDVSQNDDQMIASARRFGVRPILDSRGKLNRQATEALIREQQELGNNGDGTWTLNGSYNLRSNQPRDPSVRRRQIENVNNIVSQHRAGMETLREMERLGRELGLDSEDVIDRITAMGEGYLTNEFAGLTDRMMGIVSQIKNIGVINPSEAPAVEQALPSPINWRNITSAEQFNRAVGQWRRALQINTRSQLFGNEVMEEDVNRFTSNTSMSSQGSNRQSRPERRNPPSNRRSVSEMEDEELERRLRELRGE